jgi:hypothetical protein
MRLHRRWLVLAVPAALAAVVLAVPAASSPPSVAAPHVKAAAAADGHVTAVVHIVHRGLVQDCVYIKNGFSGLDIQGDGVNHPVFLTTGTGNCFNLLNKFTVGPFGTKSYTGYEYQNGDGHCLWDDGGTIELGAACQANHPNEEFYGVTYIDWWTVSVVTADNPNVLMGTQGNNCISTEGAGNVVMNSGGCDGWNFP